MAAIVLYWSLGGTTKRVAEAIAEGMRARDVECVLHDVRESAPHDLAQYDLVGVGFPAHYFRPPAPVSDAIRELGRLDGRSVFSFCLYGTYRGASLNRIRSALIRAGGTEVGAFACHGGGGFYAYARLGWEFSPGHPDARDLEDARAFGGSLTEAHEVARRGGVVSSLPGRDPWTDPVYSVERLVFNPWLTRVFYYRHFRVDSSRCTHCGKCARGCPAHAITWQRGELPTWSSECILCLSCARICPESAVVCPLDWPATRPFIAWNVRRAGRDPSIDHVRVELQRGATVRVDAPTRPST